MKCKYCLENCKYEIKTKRFGKQHFRTWKMANRILKANITFNVSSATITLSPRYRALL